MSPEFLDPDQFDSKDNGPTPESDCYALGMVIYEVLSGKAPFTPHRDFIVLKKVVGGERPERPLGTEGEWFPNGLWVTLGQCWSAQATDRPTILAVLECLENASTNWESLPPKARHDADMDGDESVSIESDYCTIHHLISNLLLNFQCTLKQARDLHRMATDTHIYRKTRVLLWLIQ